MRPVTSSLLLKALLRLTAGWIAVYLAVCLGVGGTRTAPWLFGIGCLLWMLVVGYTTRNRAATSTLARYRNARGVRLTGWAVCLVTLLTGGLEGSLRLHASWSGTSPAVRNALDACRLVPGLDYGVGLRGNRLGYPGPDVNPDKGPERFRIAVLGDSFAVGPVVHYEDNFVRRLEALLPGTEVCNFGVSGAGPREYDHILRTDVLPVRPDLVLVCLFSTNDVVELLPTPRHLDPRQHSLYWFAKRLLSQPDRSVKMDAPDSEGLLRHRIETGTLAPREFARVEAMRLAVCSWPPGPGIEKKWQRVSQELDSLLAACRKGRVPVAFILLPDEAQADPASLQLVLGDGGLDPEHLDLGLPQRRLLAFAASRSVPCLDLLPAFVGRTGLYVSRNTHWNQAGNRLAAEEIASWLPAVGLVSVNRPAASPRTRVP